MTEAEKHNHEKCRIFFEYLSDYIDQELDIEICGEIETHLQDCECCNTCLLTLKKTIELCRNYETRPVPAFLSEKLKR